MAKLTLNAIGSRYGSIDALNDNSDLIEAAFENTLSRDGTGPNNMEADLDMDSNSIINVANLSAGSLTIGGLPVSPGNINYTGQIKETQVATSGQTVFNLSVISYNPLTNNLSVYVDGVYQNPSRYTETNSTRVTFSTGLHVGAVVDFAVLSLNDLGGTTDAANVTYTPAGSGAVGTNVATKLQQTVSVKDFGAVGDGVTDDTAAVQAAIDACIGKRLYFPKGVYLCTSTINVVRGITIYGDGSYLTIVKFDINASTDGIVFGTGSGGVAALEDVQVYNICFEGAAQSDPALDYVRDVVLVDVIYKLTFNDVQVHGAARNALRIDQSLHTQFYNCRFEDALEESVNVTDGTNTTIVFDSCYIRISGKSGIKTNCLGLTIRSCIFEGIGYVARTSTYTYFPGVYVNGGTTYIHDMYCEDISGHNIFADAGVLYVNNGSNLAGAGTNTAQYAGLFIQGSGIAFLMGAAYCPGGGNKRGVVISSLHTGQVNGMVVNPAICTAASLSTPDQYTNCTYDVANYAALSALSPSAGQTGHVQDTGYEYTYSGSAWILVNNNQFLGRLFARNAASATYQIYGKNAYLSAGDSDNAVTQTFTEVFNANASADNVSAMQSGASIPANSQVSTNKTLSPTLDGYGGSTSQNFLANFNVAGLAAGLDVRVNITSASNVQIIVYNFTTAPVTLSADIKGRVLITKVVDL